jgi:peptidoglycan/LPS O-acetylase OafA/YrhL
LVFNFINIYNRAESGRQAVINYFIFWIVTISFSFLIYQYFERPTTALRDKKVIL